MKRKRLRGYSLSVDDADKLSIFLSTLRNKAFHARNDDKRSYEQFKTNFGITFVCIVQLKLLVFRQKKSQAVG